MTGGEQRMQEVLACKHEITDIDVCRRCGASGRAIKLYESRRSAQPAVASGFRDVDHVEVRVGDWLTNIHDGTMVQVGWLRAERPNAAQPGRALKADGSPSECRMADGLSYHWRKSSAPAPGGEKAKDSGSSVFSSADADRSDRKTEPACVDAASGAQQVAKAPMPGTSAGLDVTAWRDTHPCAEGHVFDPTQADCAVCGADTPPIKKSDPLASFKEFTKTVSDLLLPRLPKGWRIVADTSSHDGNWHLFWLLDNAGKTVLHESYAYGKRFTQSHAEQALQEVAGELLDRASRTQPDPPRTEPSWLDGYLMSRAAEKPRGGGR